MKAKHGPKCDCEDEKCLLRRKVLGKINGKMARDGIMRTGRALIDTKELRLVEAEPDESKQGEHGEREDEQAHPEGSARVG